MIENTKSDLISRQEALVLVQSLYPGIPRAPFNKKRWREKYKQYIEVEIGLTNLPPAEPERKKGRWTFSNVKDIKGRPTGQKFCTCDQCGNEEILSFRRKPFDFCPNCGAYMIS